jgi:CHASE3 domain sensor protein
MVAIESVFGERIGSAIRNSIGQIRSINQKYAKPQIELSKGAAFALLMLRLYLIFLVVLLAYKFYTIVTGGSIA